MEIRTGTQSLEVSSIRLSSHATCGSTQENIMVIWLYDLSFLGAPVVSI